MNSVSFAPTASKSWLKACEKWKESQSLPWRTRLNCLLSNSGMIHRHAKIVAHLGNDCRPTSFAIVDIPPDTAPSGWRIAWISHVWTMPQARGLGHAHSVVAGAIELASMHHAEEIALYTSRNQTVCNLYADCQFVFDPNVRYLMRATLDKFLNPSDHSSLSETRFEVGPDDLSLVGSILSRSHYSLSDNRFIRSNGVEAEETFCQMIDDGYDLGIVHFWRDTELSSWLCWVFWDGHGRLGVKLSGDQNDNRNDFEIRKTGVMSIIKSAKRNQTEEYLPPRL